MSVVYLPYAERMPDSQFRDLLVAIRDNGWWKDSPQGYRTCTLVGHQMRFLLANGFPILPDRDLMSPIQRRDKDPLPSIVHQAVGELAAFLNGARTHKEFVQFGCYWWKRFLPKDKCAKRGLEEGDNGFGYGPGWAAFPMPDGGFFNQIDAVVQQMRERPSLRTHYVHPWIPYYNFRGEGRRVVVSPCHGWLHFLIDEDKGQLTLHHWQRSCDIAVGGMANIAQYATLLLAMADVLGYTAHELVYTFSDVHIYDYKNQLKCVEELISREPRRFPTVTLTSHLERIQDLRPGHFEVTDYNPHPGMLIPTPI